MAPERVVTSSGACPCAIVSRPMMHLRTSAREGISYAMLKQFEEDAEDESRDPDAVELPAVEPERERARSTG